MPCDWNEVRTGIIKVSHRVKRLTLKVDDIVQLAELFQAMGARPWPILKRLTIEAYTEDNSQVPWSAHLSQ